MNNYSNNHRRHNQNRSHKNRHHSGGRPRPSVQDPAEREFLNRISIDPSPRIKLENGSSEWTVRAMDLLCPIGCGQRGLIVAPPGSGKTTYLKHICQAITKASPDIKLYCLLIDERPEEVTDIRRSVEADVKWSSSDQPYENHISVAENLMKEAYREANAGKDVMILLDSLTRLARVHNSASSGRRTLSGGVDADGLRIPRKIFGSARKIENGGSLGILATILIETGSRMDEVIFQEFKGTGNMEIVLSREVSGQRIFPAVNVHHTGTRKEEQLFSPREYEGVRKLRTGLANMKTVEAAKTLTSMFEKFKTNEELIEFMCSAELSGL